MKHIYIHERSRSLTMSDDKLYSFLEDMSRKMDKIQLVVHTMNDKLHNLEEKIEVMNKTQPQTQVALVTSISSSDEKIKLLNQQTNKSTQEDFLDALKSRCTITNSGIYSILDQTITIYEYIADIIYEFNNESSAKYICGISDAKSGLFFWNHEKKTWAKVTKSYLHEVFMMIQQKIILKYNELMNKDITLQKGSVENGDLIFADDFEKKFTEFKKILISRFI